MEKIKTVLCLLVFLLIMTHSSAQTFTQSAEGESSLLLRGGNLSLNSTKTQITFGANNLIKIYRDSSAWIVGGQLQGKNNEGLGSLLEGDDFSPEAKIIGILGRSWSHFPASKVDEKRVSSLKKGQEDLIYNYVTSMTTYIQDSVGDTAYGNYLINKVKKRDVFFHKEIDLPPIYTNQEGKNKREFELVRYEAFLRESKIRPELDSLSLEVEKEYKKDSLVTEPFKSTLLYARIGGNGQSFKYFTSIDQENYLDSFSDKTFTGARIGAGANYREGDVLIGANIDFVYTNSFKSLKKKTYTIKEEATNGAGQMLIAEKEIVAYTGTFEKFWTTEANFDFIKRIPVSKSNYVAISPYARWTVYSAEEKLIPKHLNLGVGGYFFSSKGKFLGGLYSEISDVTNEFEKLKDDPDLDPFYQRIKFGIVVSYSFDEILY